MYTSVPTFAAPRSSQEDTHRARVEAKLRVRFGALTAGEGQAKSRGFKQWLAFVDSINFGKYEQLANMNLDDLTKTELTKHLRVRGVGTKDIGRAGKFLLKKMLQKSLWEEAEEKGLHLELKVRGGLSSGDQAVTHLKDDLQHEESDPTKRSAFAELGCDVVLDCLVDPDEMAFPTNSVCRSLPSEPNSKLSLSAKFARWVGFLCSYFCVQTFDSFAAVQT